jgi:hypothetical protein
MLCQVQQSVEQKGFCFQILPDSNFECSARSELKRPRGIALRLILALALGAALTTGTVKAQSTTEDIGRSEGEAIAQVIATF